MSFNDAMPPLAMTGVIWTVQLVHYPLFGRVGEAGFAAYELEHSSRITLLVGPLMAVELATAALLVWRRPEGVPGAVVWVGLALVAVIWASTAFVQVPLHGRLSRGFDGRAHELLVLTNWVRTVAWSARGALAVWTVSKLLGEVR